MDTGESIENKRIYERSTHVEIKGGEFHGGVTIVAEGYVQARFDRFLRLANRISLVDSRVGDTYPTERCLASQYFPTRTDTVGRENRDPEMGIHGTVHGSPQAYQ